MTESRTAHDLLADFRTTLNQTPGYVASAEARPQSWSDALGQNWTVVQTYSGAYECSTITVAQPSIGLRETLTLGAPIDGRDKNTITLFEQFSRGETLQTVSGKSAIPVSEEVLRRLQDGTTPRR